MPKRLDIKVLADYFVTLGMKMRFDEGADGWTVWIYDEDHFARAREELQAYLNCPDDPRYEKATEIAEEIRRKQRELDQQFRKNYREVSDQWATRACAPPVDMDLGGNLRGRFSIAATRANGSRSNELWFSNIISVTTGGRERQRLRDILHGEVWRLVTPIFIHFGIMHIFFNVWGLSSLGTMIEIRRGTSGLLALVLVSAVVSNLANIFTWNGSTPGNHSPSAASLGWFMPYLVISG